MKTTFDVAILGAGTMGSAAAYHLAKRRYRVIVFEQFKVVHDLGSHSGATRIIRHAYHESPDYVPLVLRADDLWLELEAATRQTLLMRTGGIVMGPPDEPLLVGALKACETHKLPYEHLSAGQLRTRWPQFLVPDDWQACYDPKAGFLLVDPCIRMHVQQAESEGAVIHENENVTSFQDQGESIHIRTGNSSYDVARLVVSAGAWTSRLLAELKLPIVVKRKTVTWLRPKLPEQFSPEKFPVFLADLPEGILYGFPLYQHSGVKIANHSFAGLETTAEEADRHFHEEDVEDVKRFARKHLPGLTEEIIEGKVCLYSITPDEDFIIDFHPANHKILIAAGFSGHGFKFAPVVGEILADLSVQGSTRHPIQKFRLSRFPQS